MKSIIRTALVLSCFISTRAHGQVADPAALRLRYEKETIYMQGNKFVKNNQAARFRFPAIEREFTFSKDAYLEFSSSVSDRAKYKKSLTLALTFYVGSLVLIVEQEPEAALVSFAGAVVSFGYMVHYQSRGGKKFQRALWLRNRDVLLTGSTDTIGLRRRYENETIHLVGSKYMKGTEVIRHFENDFLVSGEGLKEMKLANQDLKKARPSSLLGLGFLVTSFVLAAHHEQPAAGIAFGAAFLTLPITYHYLFRGSRRFQKALWLRNRDALLTK